jgi:Putative auto-transporter adhesin, head GIN domain
MLRPVTILKTALAVTIFSILTSCCEEDPGPMQETRKEYALVDFDRLEMGSAFNIEVEQANAFSVKVKGDRRNIDDLNVYKNGSTLVVEFDDDDANRHHDTYIYITMPSLKGVNFSGASVSKIRGFESDEDLDFSLSGASISQLDANYREVELVVSGASSLVMFGSGDQFHAEISGASTIKTFDYPVREAMIDISGASEGKVAVTEQLEVTAGGASSVLYRGNPSVVSNISGASTVQKD